MPVIVRYRCRLHPPRGQRQVLARVPGCARVAFSDCLAAFRAADAKTRS